MADTPMQALARFDQNVGWQERRRSPGVPSPFSVRSAPDLSKWDDDDEMRADAPPMTRRWRSDDEDDDPAVGLALASIAVILIVVLLIGVTLVI
jgi:hypothetical protein